MNMSPIGEPVIYPSICPIEIKFIAQAYIFVLARCTFWCNSHIIISASSWLTAWQHKADSGVRSIQQTW